MPVTRVTQRPSRAGSDKPGAWAASPLLALPDGLMPEGLSWPEGLRLPEGIALPEGFAMPEEIAAWAASTPTVALLVVAALGAVYCFVGYRALRTLLALLGVMLAGPVAALLAGAMSGGHGPAMVIGFLAGGFCGAMALHFLYKSGVFLLGMLGAAAIAATAMPEPGELWHLGAVLGAGLIGGMLAMWLERPALRVATAGLGALLMTHAAHALAGGNETTDPTRLASQPLLLVLWIGLAGLGVGAQFGGRPRRRARR